MTLTPTHLLLAVVTTATAGLALYAGLLVSTAVAGLIGRRRSPVYEGQAARSVWPAVTVLVPCHLEGEGARRAVMSLVAQDYPGTLVVVALLSPGDAVTAAALAGLEAPRSRALFVVVCRERGKAAKLNEALATVDTPYVAFLDADHRARPPWVRRSVEVLERPASGPGTIAGVQGRRSPIAVGTAWQLVDSAQAHAGNELLNAARTALGEPVFFTGTTAVFRTSSLTCADPGGPFGASVTEDTELSFRLLADGERIEALPSTGSAEEVAPDLRSFVHRRRRWARGHTEVFLRWLAAGARAPSAARRAHLFLHGAFYLSPLFAWAALVAMSVFLWPQLDDGLRLLATLAAVGLGALLTFVLFGAQAVELLVVALWLLPQTLLGLPLLLRPLEDERYWLLIQFPGALLWLGVYGVLIALPLVALIVAVVAERPFSLRHLVRLVLAYPAWLVAEVLAVLVGVVDVALGRSRWPRVRRTLEEEGAGEMEPRMARHALVGLGIAVATLGTAVLVHDAALTSGCAGGGSGRAPFWLEDKRPAFSFSLLRQRAGEELDVRGVVQLLRAAEGATTFRIRQWLDERELPVSSSVSLPGDVAAAEVALPLGFARHRWRAEVVERGDDVTCRFAEVFTDTIRDVRGRVLEVNGEPFLVKGVVPSFALGRGAPSTAEGLRALHGLGANTVRYYRPASDEVSNLAEEIGLMLIEQPTASTWDEMDVRAPIEAARLRGRVRAALQKDTERPTSLLLNVGNELELLDPGTRTGPLQDLIRRLAADHPGRLFGYATFFLFVDYEAPVLGINMLDSGRTYWRESLRILQDRGRPFYASELGAFVALTERPPEVLRAARLVEQWRALQRAGAIGGVVFQSHDNWSQPVPSGLNDPFLAEQPDDRRGLFDRDGHPTPLVEVVARLFSDVDVAWEGGAEAQLTNRRPYPLRSLELVEDPGGDGLGADVVDVLLSGETVTVVVPERAAREEPLFVRYRTHRGLPSVSRLPPLGGGLPTLVQGEALVRERTVTRLVLDVFAAEDLAVWIPASWPAAEVDGRSARPGTVVHVGARPTLTTLTTEESVDEDRGAEASRVHTLRFRLPEPQGGYLLFAGLGTSSVTLSCAEAPLPAHPYRELVVERAALRSDDGECAASFLRSSSTFLHAGTTVRGERVPIALEPVRWFRPWTVTVTRAEADGAEAVLPVQK